MLLIPDRAPDDVPDGDAPQLSVSLTGPNVNNAMECTFSATPDIVTRYEVFWFWVRSGGNKLLPAGQNHGFYNVAELPKTGRVGKVEIN
ncbi:hypothetical protein BaRGS_00024481 [Batillaria attramentaria]|uniref:Uncharacterized protein n=1 Tax=Batillaria attramentaria TaxID=370345 RepID=A0ABD0KB20_9CAEN